MQGNEQGEKDLLRQAENTIELASAANDRFETGDFETKKTILSAIGSNLKLKDKKLLFEAKVPFLLLEKSNSRHYSEKKVIEPTNSRSIEPSDTNSNRHESKLLRDLDDDRTYGVRERNLVRSIYHFFKKLRYDPPHLWN